MDFTITYKEGNRYAEIDVKGYTPSAVHAHVHNSMTIDDLKSMRDYLTQIIEIAEKPREPQIYTRSLFGV